MSDKLNILFSSLIARHAFKMANTNIVYVISVFNDIGSLFSIDTICYFTIDDENKNVYISNIQLHNYINTILLCIHSYNDYNNLLTKKLYAYMIDISLKSNYYIHEFHKKFVQNMYDVFITQNIEIINYELLCEIDKLITKSKDNCLLCGDNKLYGIFCETHYMFITKKYMNNLSFLAFGNRYRSDCVTFRIKSKLIKKNNSLICIHETCKYAAEYNYENRMPLFCAYHKKIFMTNTIENFKLCYVKKCYEFNCLNHINKNIDSFDDEYQDYTKNFNSWCMGCGEQEYCKCILFNISDNEL